MMKNKKVLWVDDEIDLLKSHIMFLGGKGYEITPVTNGEDAIALVSKQNFDVVLLDEMMPGRDGLSTLVELKKLRPGLPAIMITKNEEESLMNEAIGSQIDDYLTKPVNPSQILSALKKITEGKKIAGERLSVDYVREFNRINALMENAGWEDWVNIHLKLSEWELELDRHPDLGMQQSLEGQRESCNIEFAGFIERNYPVWVGSSERPVMSPDLTREHLLPVLKSGKKAVFVVIDCMRLDQWLALEDLLAEYFHISRDYYCSILPSATPYARNSLFSGLFPLEIQEQYSDIWDRGEEDETSSNRYERQLLDYQVERAGIRLKPEAKYIKILDPEEAANVERKVSDLFNSPLVSLVVNFVDMLAHSRSSSDVIREMVPHEAAYRSVVRSWFEHSSLYSILKAFAAQKNTVVLMTSDHGSIRCHRGTRVVSDKEASANLRYKYGRNLKCDRRHAIYVADPAEYKLPRRSINENYIFAREDYYFVYPTNYNKYLNYFRNSFQHGGVSLEENILPVYILEGR